MELINRSHYKPEIDSFKGILIVLIVFGHDYWVSLYFNKAFSTLYNFHVVSFLFLPFILSRSSVNLPKLKNQIFRLFIPHIAFFILLGALFFLIYVDKNYQDIIIWLEHLIRAITFQNQLLFKAAVGFGYLWFLPALIMIQLVLFGYLSCTKPYKIIFLFTAFTLHLTIGYFAPTNAPILPFSSYLVAYIVFPAFIIRFIHQNFQWNRIFDFLVIINFCLLTLYCYRNNLFLGLAGGVTLMGLGSIPRIIFHDAVLIVSFFAVLRLAYYLRSSLFVDLGQYSLQIFLLHPLIWQVIWRIMGNLLNPETLIFQIILVFISTTIHIFITYLCAKYFMALRISPLVFPKDIVNWKTTLFKSS